ncbi:phospholipase C/P1 nuclease domain-containing protein [Trametes polyzona]|nr:phospholipase C/P1 nuclease domain-containing protein [Trametes polyzona]
MRSALFLSLIVSLASVQGTYAWNAPGHEIVANIAQIHLPKPVLSIVCSILTLNQSTSSTPLMEMAYPPCHLAQIASWADTVRRRPEYLYCAQMHFANAVDDAPPLSCPFPGPRGWAGSPTGNIFAALGNVTSILREFTRGGRSVDEAQEALKFLVHWMGDMHQPLHMTGREKGGNAALVTWNGQVTSLHSVWDGFLITQAIQLTPQNYSRPLPGAKGALVEPHLRGAVYDRYLRRIMHEGLAIGGRFDTESDSWMDCPEHPSTEPHRIKAVASNAGMQGVLGYTLRLLGVGEAERVGAWLSLDLPAALGLTTRTSKVKSWDDAKVCPYAWAVPIHALNCDASLPIWPHELDAPGTHNLEDWHGKPRHTELLELRTPEYAGRIAKEWVVERLLAMGGVRLAGVLTDIFADVAGAGGYAV